MQWYARYSTQVGTTIAMLRDSLHSNWQRASELRQQSLTTHKSFKSTPRWVRVGVCKYAKNTENDRERSGRGMKNNVLKS